MKFTTILRLFTTLVILLFSTTAFSQPLNTTTLTGLWHFEAITDTFYSTQDSVLTDTLITRNDSTFQSYTDSMLLTADVYNKWLPDSPTIKLALKNCTGFIDPNIAHLINLNYIGAGWYFDAARNALVFLVPQTGEEFVYNITGWDGTSLSLCKTDQSGNLNKDGSWGYPNFKKIRRMVLKKA